MEFNDCGILTLKYYIKENYKKIGYYQIASLAGYKGQATTFLDLKNALVKLNYQVEAYQTELNYLQNIYLPCIAQVIINNQTHFVVIIKKSHSKIIYFDPSFGKVKTTINKFNGIFNNKILTAKLISQIEFKITKSYFKYKLIRIFKQNQFQVACAVFLSLFLSLLTIVDTIYLEQIINAKSSLKIGVFLIIIISWLLFTYFKEILSYLFQKYLVYLTTKISFMINVQIIKKFITLPISYINSRNLGDLNYRLGAAGLFNEGLLSLISIFSSSVVIFLSMTIVILKNYYLGLIIAIVVMFNLIYYLFKIPNIIKESSELNNTEVRYNQTLIDKIKGYETIYNHRLGEYVKDILTKQYSQLIIKTRSSAGKIIKYNFKIQLFNKLFIIIIISYCFLLLRSNYLSVASFAIIIMLIFILINELNKLIINMPLLKDIYIAYLRLEELFANNFRQNQLATKESHLEFKGLSYRYPGAEILSNFNLTIDKKATLIKGQSGLGKSTIFKLLVGYDNYKGIINANSKDMLYVSQTETIFNETIKHNIILNQVYDANKYQRITQLMSLNNFSPDEIIKDSVISGGERSKIIIARALYKSPNLLILDETLNSLDKATADKVLNSIINYYHDKNLIYISHYKQDESLFEQVIHLKKEVLCNK